MGEILYGAIAYLESTAWEPDGNRVLILPSILAVISNQGINDMMLILEEERIDGQAEEPDELAGGEREEEQM